MYEHQLSTTQPVKQVCKVFCGDFPKLKKQPSGCHSDFIRVALVGIFNRACITDWR